MISALQFGRTLQVLWDSTGFAQGDWRNYVMLVISFVLLYLAIVRGFEPLLLVPIAFGMLMVNIPGAADILLGKDHFLQEEGLLNDILAANPNYETDFGLFHYIGLGVKHVISPPLVFLGIGAMTDFGPMIANPKSLIVGAGAQLGVFVTFVGAILLGKAETLAAAIAIIGGADGPTAIYVTQILSPANLSAIVIAAYSYMALIPIIQPPIMKLLTTKKERLIKMKQLRTVSKKEKIIFPILVTVVVGIILPSALPLIGMLMLGNLLKVCGVTERLAEVASNALINIVTILLGLIVGTKALGSTFLDLKTLEIIALGLLAFGISTAGGIITVKIINLFSKNKMNPLIGSAGVSAVPMAARVSQKMGMQYDSSNYLLMHAMGPNVAGVIGSGVAAGVLLAIFA
jgi:oxaloacetate decarboxylase beta subunit